MKILQSILYQHVVGLKETLKALRAQSVRSLIIAKDTNIHLLTDVLLLADQQNIPITFNASKHSLGEQFGIQVKATVVAHLKDSL